MTHDFHSFSEITMEECSEQECSWHETVEKLNHMENLLSNLENLEQLDKRVTRPNVTESQINEGTGKRPYHFHIRDRGELWRQAEIDEMPNDCFKGNFRMNRPCFELLAEKMCPLYPRQGMHPA